MNAKNYKGLDYSNMSTKAINVLKRHLKRKIRVYNIQDEDKRILEEEIAWMTFEAQTRDVLESKEIIYN